MHFKWMNSLDLKFYHFAVTDQTSYDFEFELLEVFSLSFLASRSVVTFFLPWFFVCRNNLLNNFNIVWMERISFFIQMKIGELILPQ